MLAGDFDLPKPVQGATPDPSLALVRSLTPRLSPEDDEKLCNKILTDYHAGLSDRTEWENRVAEWEDAYYNRVPDKDFPWAGAANFHVPLTMMGVETFKPRLVEAVLGMDPPIMVAPTRGVDEDRNDIVETFLNWQIKAELDLEPTVTQSAHLFLQPGLVVAKTYWKVDRITRKMVREFPPGTQIPDIIEALFGDEKPRNLESEGGLKFTGKIPAPGNEPLNVKLEFKIINEPDLKVIQVLVEKEELIERPQVDLVDATDIIAPVKGGHTVMEQPWIQQRLWYTEDELRRKARDGRFYEDVVEQLIKSGAPRGDQPLTDSQLYREKLDITEGVEGQGPSNVKRTEWEVLECYLRYDIDDDGWEEEVIVWVAPDCRRQVLGWDYLDNVYAHGRRPLRVGRYFPVPFRWYGLSFAEVIKGIQDEINTIHNQRVDYATIQNLPFGFKKASATMPPITQRLRPGEFVDVDNPQTDILIPRWQGSPAWGQQEEAVLMQYFERLSGLTDLSVGRQPNRVGATRTAAGTQTLLSESGLRFKNAMQEFQRFWVGIFEDILALDQEYLPPRKEFRVTGRRPTTIQLKDRTEIRGKYDLRLVANSETMNRQRQRDDATVMMQALLNPALIQGGLVGFKGIKQVLTDFLKAFGKDPDFYLEPKAPILTPYEELQKFVGGSYVSPVAGEDLEGHIMAHQEALMDPVVPGPAKKLIQKHLQETYQLVQAQQMAQTMQQQGPGGGPPVGQQATNAQTGAQPQPGPGEPPVQTPPNAGMAG